MDVFKSEEGLRVTLNSIGDAVIAVDAACRVAFINRVAQDLTGWAQAEAEGEPLEKVFVIINEKTRKRVEAPVARVLREGAAAGLAPHTLLLSKDGTERRIEDSAAPIRDDRGEVFGVILVFRDVTEKKRLGEALRQRELAEAAQGHFRALFESAPGLFLVLKPDLEIAAVSDAYLAGTMTKREEIVGRYLFEVFPDNPDDPAANGVVNLRASLEAVRRTRTANTMAVQKYDVRRPESEGGGFEERYWSPVNSPVLGADGEVAFIIHRVEDVTEFVRRKNASPPPPLETEAARWRADQMEAEIFLRGRQLEQVVARLQEANEALVAELEERERREETLKKLHDELETRVQERTAALAGSNAALQEEISERARAEESLKEKEHQFRTLADSIPQLAWMTRADGHIIWYNRRWYDYTGTTPEMMEGWGWQSVHDPAELPRVMVNWRAALASGEPWEDTFPLRRSDGSMRWHLSRALPVRDEQGRVVHWFGTNTDITDRIDMEAALKEGDRRKNEFLAMLAHELRNPLAPIRNGLQIIRLPDADVKAIEKAQSMMERQIQHMTRIVDDLLDVSRIQRGKVALQIERLDLARLARQTVEDRSAAFTEAGVELAFESRQSPLWVQGDPTRLTQVLGNLLQNAVKFTDRGGKVVVRLEPQPARGRVALTVKDTGVGIEPELLPRLFDTFAQADRSLDRTKGGLGLGLALVKALVELHEGEVYATSAGPGQGSEFVVRLPFQPEAAPVVRERAGSRPSQERLRVLVVEDSKDAADSLQMLLELYGHEVAVAYSGTGGVKAAGEWRPDVILCDIGLPGMSGYEVANELRRNPATAKARMIAVTGYGAEEDRIKSRQAGFDQHLVKPVDPATLQGLFARSESAV